MAFDIHELHSSQMRVRRVKKQLHSIYEWCVCSRVQEFQMTICFELFSVFSLYSVALYVLWVKRNERMLAYV